MKHFHKILKRVIYGSSNDVQKLKWYWLDTLNVTTFQLALVTENICILSLQ